ncbi:MAG: phosphate--acyl-ACP acyltransferase [Bacillota bacterium]|nr:phosphate--acyl-ACP acyltransferase [Bacillota bacterium]
MPEPDRPVRVALDAFSGDHAPGELVAGALAALEEEPGLEVLLVGPGPLLREEIERRGGSAWLRSGRLHPVEAARRVEEGESPVRLIQRDPELSVAVTARLVRDGRADAGVSVGHTGATLAAATLILGLLPGIERPAAGLALPFAPHTFLVDLGPNVDVTARHLLDFARMGVVYAQTFLGVREPTVALLANGQERGKGNRQTRAAYELLERSGLRFRGYVEGQDVVLGSADVVVVDGFTGNILLKFLEGLAAYLAGRLRAAVAGAGLAPAGELGRLLDLLEQLSDATQLPSVPVLLGVDGLFLPGHGRSRAAQVRHLLRSAAEAVRNGLLPRLREALRSEEAMRG